MTRTVLRHLAPVDGNEPRRPATIGLDINDAAYHTAHDWPGGVPALAQRMGMSQHSLAHKVGLNNTAHLSPAEMVKMQAITGDCRMLHAMAGALGHVCVSLESDGRRSTLETVMRMAKEFGDVCVSVNAAVSDGSVTLNEMRECERQAGELMLALQAVLATVRGMMPPAPGAAA